MEYKIRPYAWQLKALEEAEFRDNYALWAECGTGKSHAMILILRMRMNKARRMMKTIIFGPAATLYNWEEEILKFSKIKKDFIMVLDGTGPKRVKAMQAIGEEPKIVIINYEAVINDDLFNAIVQWKPEIIIADEIHMIKSGKSQRTKKLIRLSKLASYRYGLSGSPILNSVKDIFSQFMFLDHGETFGRFVGGFQAKYMIDKNAGWSSSKRYFPNWQPRPEAFAELNEKMYRNAIRVTKRECLPDLPPLITIKKICELSKEQKKLYEEMKRDFITFIEDNEGNKNPIVAQLALTKCLRLQQIVSGFVQTDEGKVIQIKDNPRIELLEELILGIYRNNKVIIWCCFKNDYELISKMLNKKRIGHTFLTGGMTTKQKQESIVAFRSNNEVPVIIANRRAGGTGINLIEASYSVVYSRDFNYGSELQSESRNHRSGSQMHEKITKINIIAKGTIDELILEALSTKQKLSDDIVDKLKEQK